MKVDLSNRPAALVVGHSLFNQVSRFHPLTTVIRKEEEKLTIYASIAAENTAKPAHPTAAACGPAPLANTPPVMHPPATPFQMSFLARSPSIAHSVPLKTAPTFAKFLPDDLDDWYMSRRPCLSCWRKGRSVIGTDALGESVDGRGAVAVAVAVALVDAAVDAVDERAADVGGLTDDAAEETVLAPVAGVAAEGFAFCVAATAAVVDGAAGVWTARGCDIGVS